MSTITLGTAQLIADRARQKSSEIDVPVAVAIVDAGGYLKMFACMDDALIGAIDVAIRKARTAALFNCGTNELRELTRPDGPLFGIETSNGGLIAFPGGLPLKNEAETVGAIGVAGGTVEQDHAIAQVGVAALKEVTQPQNI